MSSPWAKESGDWIDDDLSAERYGLKGDEPEDITQELELLRAGVDHLCRGTNLMSIGSVERRRSVTGL
jgi:hypothetical protein